MVVLSTHPLSTKYFGLFETTTSWIILCIIKSPSFNDHHLSSSGQTIWPLVKLTTKNDHQTVALRHKPSSGHTVCSPNFWNTSPKKRWPHSLTTIFCPNTVKRSLENNKLLSVRFCVEGQHQVGRGEAGAGAVRAQPRRHGPELDWEVHRVPSLNTIHRSDKDL